MLKKAMKILRTLLNFEYVKIIILSLILKEEIIVILLENIEVIRFVLPMLN